VKEEGKGLHFTFTCKLICAKSQVIDVFIIIIITITITIIIIIIIIIIIKSPQTTLIVYLLLSNVPIFYGPLVRVPSKLEQWIWMISKTSH